MAEITLTHNQPDIVPASITATNGDSIKFIAKNGDFNIIFQNPSFFSPTPINPVLITPTSPKSFRLQNAANDSVILFTYECLTCKHTNLEAPIRIVVGNVGDINMIKKLLKLKELVEDIINISIKRK